MPEEEQQKELEEEEEQKRVYLQQRPAARLGLGGRGRGAELAGARHQLLVPLLQV